ncbi:cytochrome oxidase small assembly protein [Pusillimonas sp.]
MTPEQRRRNRIGGIILAIIVIAIFAWTFLRGSVLMN